MGQFGTRFRLKFPQCLITKGAFCSLMNGKSTLALVGVLFAAAMVVGMATTSAFSTPLVIASSGTDVNNQFGMLGHITFTVRDADGVLKSYVQTDNTIVNVGENCVAELLFNVTSAGTEPCDGASTAVYASGNGINEDTFKFIAIGDETGDATSPANQAAEDGTALVGENTTSTMVRKSGNPTVTNNSEGTGSGSSTIVELSAVFTSDGGISNIDESGIFDEPTNTSGSGAGPGNMLARQTFTNIQLNAGDQLTVEWEITIGSDTPGV